MSRRVVVPIVVVAAPQSLPAPAGAREKPRLLRFGNRAFLVAGGRA